MHLAAVCQSTEPVAVVVVVLCRSLIYPSSQHSHGWSSPTMRWDRHLLFVDVAVADVAVRSRYIHRYIPYDLHFSSCINQHPASLMTWLKSCLGVHL